MKRAYLAWRPSFRNSGCPFPCPGSLEQMVLSAAVIWGCPHPPPPPGGWFFFLRRSWGSCVHPLKCAGPTCPPTYRQPGAWGGGHTAHLTPLASGGFEPSRSREGLPVWCLDASFLESAPERGPEPGCVAAQTGPAGLSLPVTRIGREIHVWNLREIVL